MAVSGLLAQYLAVKNQLNYNQLQQTRWNNMATAMSKKLSDQSTAEDKWLSASESAFDSAFDPSKEIVYQGNTYKAKEVKCQEDAARKIATQYANAKVPKFDSELLEEYTDLDMEYSTMQAMYDTLCTELEAQEGSLKEQLGTEAQDTHLLGS